MNVQRYMWIDTNRPRPSQKNYSLGRYCEKAVEIGANVFVQHKFGTIPRTGNVYNYLKATLGIIRV